MHRSMKWLAVTTLCLAAPAMAGEVNGQGDVTPVKCGPPVGGHHGTFEARPMERAPHRGPQRRDPPQRSRPPRGLLAPRSTWRAHRIMPTHAAA